MGESISEIKDDPHSDATTKTCHSQIQRPLVHYERSVVERLLYVARKKDNRANCMDKNFYRGKDFNFTDTGNHYGQTHIQTQSVSQRRCVALRDNSTKYVQDADQHSDIFTIHMQSTTFEEILMHTLRGAADSGFNQFSEKNVCKKGTENIHYCLKWNDLMSTKLDPRVMKSNYQGWCARLANGRIPLPIKHIFHAPKPFSPVIAN